jgi:glucose-1-phosphate adenylyltransferase
VHNGVIAEGSLLDRCDVSNSVIGIRSIISRGARIRQSVLLGADLYETSAAAAASDVPIGIGTDVEIERAIVDKNARIGDGARLVNSKNLDEYDGDGYYIRHGIIIVPKAAVIRPGFAL